MSSSDRTSEAFHSKRPLHLRPCLLLLIGETPAHGYDLLERLTTFGFERDPGGLYRTLRAMEHEGLVRSEWEISSNGPGRRRYELTPPGRERLHDEAMCLLETGRMVEAYLRRYGVLEDRAAPSART
jgi:PadR family transcriptional regulator, regulatory protein PadR